MTNQIVDQSPLATTLESFFETKTSCDVEGTMAYFSPNLSSYINATLGWDLDSYDALQGVFATTTCTASSVRRPNTDPNERDLLVVIHESFDELKAVTAGE